MTLDTEGYTQAAAQADAERERRMDLWRARVTYDDIPDSLGGSITIRFPWDRPIHLTEAEAYTLAEEIMANRAPSRPDAAAALLSTQGPDRYALAAVLREQVYNLPAWEDALSPFEVRRPARRTLRRARRVACVALPLCP